MKLAAILAILTAIVAALCLGNRIYWYILRLQARNTGIFRDDRRENDQR
jgi:hypothetical protein